MTDAARHMKASHIAVLGLGAAVVVALLAYPAFAQSTSTSTTSTSTSSGPPGPWHGFAQGIKGLLGGQGGPGFGPFGGPGGPGGPNSSAPTFTTGQVINVTSTSGTYFVVGTQGKTNGTASGTLTFTVAGALTGGYVLNIRGSITVAGTTYTITSGSGVMGPGGANIQGEGATSSSGTYILRASAHGDFTGTDSSRVSLDFSNGTTEYIVSLTGTITG